jgi:hypothetical protein
MSPDQVLARIKTEKPRLTRWLHIQSERRRIKRLQRRAIAVGKCRQCNRTSEINPQTRKPFRYCAVCRKKVSDYSAIVRKALAGC